MYAPNYFCPIPFRCILPLAIALFFSCNLPEPSVTPPDNVSQMNPQPPAEPEVQPEEERVKVEPVQILRKGSFKDSSGLKHRKYEITARTIDSLNAITPFYNASNYNHLAVSYFTLLAHSLHGRPYFVSESDSLVNAVMDILTSRLNEGTDIVFLIDKTASMDDDIANVKKSLNLIMDYLSHFKQVKIGMAAYGDKNYHYDLWYNKIELTNNIADLRKYLDGLITIGNPDVPESVNEGIVNTVENMNWTPGNKRLMLVIGDAPSQEPPYSGYSAQQVVEKCKAMNVLFNLYPVIISAAFNSDDKPIKRDFVKFYPNPAHEFYQLTFSEEGNYTYEMNDLSGKIVMQNSTQGIFEKINTLDIPPGTYLLQVFNNDKTKYFSSPLVVVH